MPTDLRTKWQKLSEQLLPCELLPDDKQFVFEFLPRNKGFRKTAINGYKSMWLAAMILEPREPAKQNMGRRAANTWLRLNYADRSL